MTNHHHVDDFVRAMMTCVVSKYSTVWQQRMTPFFYFCLIADLSVFEWVQTKMNAVSVCIDQSVLEAWDYSPKKFKVPNMGNWLTETLEGVTKSSKDAGTSARRRTSRCS